MSIEAFYALVSGICFTLVGLWWNVVKNRSDWLADERLRRLAGGVYLSFLIPGLMSLFAQISGENALIWRGVFTVAAILGGVFTSRLISQTRTVPNPGPFRRQQWVVIGLYAIILIVAVFPGLAALMGLQPLQAEGLLVCLLIFIAHGLTWEFLTETKKT